MDIDDDDNILRRPQRVEKRPMEAFLHQHLERVRSWLRYVRETLNFEIR